MTKRTIAARWRRKVGVRGVTVAILPLNLPNHASATIEQQARWVVRKMRRTDLATIAECPAALAKAINSRRGLACRLATPNLGGNGNAIVVNTQRVDDPVFSDYPISFTANSGARYTLHMARARVTKGKAKIVVDGVHAPSRGRYKTSAPDGAREHVFDVIARQSPKDADIRFVSGDTNWTVRQVISAMQKVDRGWRHVGGSGVEQVYALGARRLGQRSMRYGRVSDHATTAKVKVGARV